MSDSLETFTGIYWNYDPHWVDGNWGISMILGTRRNPEASPGEDRNRGYGSVSADFCIFLFSA